MSWLIFLAVFLAAESIRREVRKQMNTIVEQLNANTAEINAAKEQAIKIKAEVVTKLAELNLTIQNLTDAINSGTPTPEVQAALEAHTSAVASLKGVLQQVDETIPDAPAPEPETPVTQTDGN